MEKKINIPQRGAARKWAKRLKELAQKKPPRSLIDKVNKQGENKKSASLKKPNWDLDI